MFNAGLARSHGGQICLTGARSAGCYGATWIWPPWLRSQATWVHEMGHALGLEHTARDAGHQYGNLWDAMSENGACGIDSEYGPLAQHLIAYHKDLLGWIPASAKLLLAAPGETTFKLAPLAQPAADNSYLLAQIPIDGSDRHFYTLEARTRTGYDRHLPSDAVIIHEVDLRMPRLLRGVPAYVRWQGSLRDNPAAAVFYDRRGITMALKRQDEDGFTVTVRTTPPEVSQEAAAPNMAAPNLAAPVLPQSLLAEIERAHQIQADGYGAPHSLDAALGQIPRSQLAFATDEMGREHILWFEVNETGTDAFYAVRQPDQTQSGFVRLDPGVDAGTMAEPAWRPAPAATCMRRGCRCIRVAGRWFSGCCRTTWGGGPARSESAP